MSTLFIDLKYAIHMLAKSPGSASIALITLAIGFSLVPLRFLIHLLHSIRQWYGDLLYDIRMWGPLTYLGVALLVAFVALGACGLPAHRAQRSTLWRP